MGVIWRADQRVEAEAECRVSTNLYKCRKGTRAFAVLGKPWLGLNHGMKLRFSAAGRGDGNWVGRTGQGSMRGVLR